MKKTGKLLVMTLVGLGGFTLCAGQGRLGDYFQGQDLHLSAESVMHNAPKKDQQIMIFQKGFSMSITGNRLKSDSAVLWLDKKTDQYRGSINVSYNARVYLQGNVSLKKMAASKSSALDRTIIDKGHSLVARFPVSGGVFITAENKRQVTLEQLEKINIFNDALKYAQPVKMSPLLNPEALVPGIRHRGMAQKEQVIAKDKSWQQTDVLGLPAEKTGTQAQPLQKSREKPQKPEYQYPVNIAGMWEPGPEIRSEPGPDGKTITTVIGRVYLWQKRSDSGDVLEFQADNAVLFSEGKMNKSREDSGSDLGFANVNAVYLRGNIVMTEMDRTVRADEFYYDFQKRQGLAVNASLRTFDEKRKIPVYLRAETMRQVSENVFEAEDIVLTSSEFYVPQVALNASSIVVTDLSGIQARQLPQGYDQDDKFDAVLKDVTLKLDQMPVFYWPKIRTNLQRPDIPIKRLSGGYDSEFGATVETRWHLSRLLGRKEPPGVDSTLAVDYYGKRGSGAGAEIKYKNADYYGFLKGYILDDRGTDDLGNTESRRNIDSKEDLRGRFKWRHRHYLPYDWQLTMEVAYASDRNFIEWFYRNEFDTGKEQETLVHLKRIKDNWGFSVLGKFRINDHATQTEELPTVEYHLKGLSLWDHQLTLYSDTQISRLRTRYEFGTEGPRPEKFHTFISTRNQIDAPLMIGTMKVVPFVAGTYGFEDQDFAGFNTQLDGTAANAEDNVYLGEAGLRLATQFWKSDPSAKSRLWDINGLRHIIKPHAEVVYYEPSDSVIDMRQSINLGVLQRWQTHRGTEKNQRTLDWMRLDINATWLNDRLGSEYGPASFIWNNNSIPVLLRKNAIDYGILRNSITADYLWRVSDTLNVLSDMNYDMQSGVVQQFNFGMSRFIFPDISYYIGSRYLKRLTLNIPQDNVYEKGSHSVVTSMSYQLNERYTLAVAQEYNFDFGENVTTEVTLLRKYHRMYYGLTFERDDSRDRDSLNFSIWPEGVSELAYGQREYIALTSRSMAE